MCDKNKSECIGDHGVEHLIRFDWYSFEVKKSRKGKPSLPLPPLLKKHILTSDTVIGGKYTIVVIKEGRENRKDSTLK